IVDGLAACGDRPELLALLVLLVTRFETDDSVRELADSLLQKAQAAKTDPAKWCLAASVCGGAGRRDVALAACRAGRAVRPDAARAPAVPAEDPAAPAARRLRADALYRLAELSAAPNPKGGAPVWDGDKVAAALRALDDLTPDERADPGAAAAAAALQLKGVGNAAA